MSEGWEKRKVNYENIHRISGDDFEHLVRGLELKNGNRIADLMCGYGAVTREILKYCGERNMPVYPVLLDKYPEQLERSREVLKGYSVERVLADVRECPLEDKSFDKVVIKMALHEVPQSEQQRVIDQCYRILKDDGKFLTWNISLSGEDQAVFQDILREKDRLAGLASLAENRYFCRTDQIFGYLRSAGFKEFHMVREMAFDMAPERRLHGEFGGDEGKLEEWNQFIRKRVPESLKEKLGYIDKGKIIEMKFWQGIISARK